MRGSPRHRLCAQNRKMNTTQKLPERASALQHADIMIFNPSWKNRARLRCPCYSLIKWDIVVWHHSSLDCSWDLWTQIAC